VRREGDAQIDEGPAEDPANSHGQR
jgi:hypothetical protein